jgi:hypothetical protein
MIRFLGNLDSFVRQPKGRVKLPSFGHTERGKSAKMNRREGEMPAQVVEKKITG